MAQPGDIEALARAAADEPELPEELEAYARIEGLMGQEHALLLIPAASLFFASPSSFPTTYPSVSPGPPGTALARAQRS